MDFETLSSGTCLWGYGEWDFTPTIKYGMAGHSTSGQVASGGVDSAARLYMKTLVFNPCSDDEIVLCYMDLLTGSIALLQRVYLLMPELRNRLVLVGSHTHYGPGNYFGNRFYDGFAQTSQNNPAGRNLAPALVDHLAKAIIATVKQARGECQQGSVAVLRSKHWESAANRSYIAFQQNPESAIWNSSGMPAANPPSSLDPLEKAIDPRVTTILAVNDDADHVCAFSTANCHTTCLGPYNNFRYSADWPGIAANHFKTSATAGATYHSAFALGAAGDASSLDSIHLPTGGGDTAGQGDGLKDRRGQEIGDHVSDLVQSALPSVISATDPINVSLRSAWWSATGGIARPARAGWPLAAGAEDGHGLRPPLREGIRWNPPVGSWREWALRNHFRYQYPKIFIAGFLQNLFRFLFEVPNYHPVCQLRIGTHLFLSAPCELSAVAGLRTETVITKIDSSVTSASMLTSTNSYMGYITTYEEYQSQQYEGGHNLFGFETLTHFVRGHIALRNMGMSVGRSVAGEKRTVEIGQALGLLQDETLLNDAPPESLQQQTTDEGQLETAMVETLRQLELGPIYEFETIEKENAEAEAQEVADGREKREMLARLWGADAPELQQAPQQPEIQPGEALEFFEVTVLFLSDKEIDSDQAALLRYGDQTYESMLIASFGDFGEAQKDVVVAIFLIPGRPVDGQSIELIAP